jgi:hypothetical protein
MDYVKRSIHRSVREIRKEELIEKTGFDEKPGNPVKSDLLFSVKRPMLGKDMEVMIYRKSPGDFQGIFFSTSGGDKITDEHSDLQFLLRRLGG